MSAIVLFDGVCNLCNKSVQFIIKRDPQGYFKFASQQSETGKQLIEKYNIDPNVKTIILIEDDRYFTKSTAALRISRQLTGRSRFAIAFVLVPKVIRNVAYDIVAKNRYRWFGKSESCMLPSKEMKERFLE